MQNHTVTFLPQNISVPVIQGTSLLRAQQMAGLTSDAPCGGRGTCGKCRVLLDGQEVLACKTPVQSDMTVTLPETQALRILTDGLETEVTPDGATPFVLAVDVGTTTVAAYLMDGHSGKLLAEGSSPNPQAGYGADVISRLQRAMHGEGQELTSCIRRCIHNLSDSLSQQTGIPSQEIGIVSIVGNTAMHHLLLGFDPQPLVTPPYMPGTTEALTLSVPPRREIRILPNIAGFVGGDTVGCMLSAGFDWLEEITLLIDIGTNGEMVLGSKKRRIACSTAAGPAFEGAKISCGMRGAPGAVDHVWLEDGQIRWHVIGECEAIGLCGSGLLDLTAVLLELGVIEESGRMPCKVYRLGSISLTQKDVREVQLAKAAIRAGIELMAAEMGICLEHIRQVLLAGAFGSYLSPASACRIGMIPPILLSRITAIGNAAGAGARMCALNVSEFRRSSELASQTEFLELASLPDFQDRYVDALEFEEECP